ncbi:aldo-keto reductase family 1 member B1-like [Tribolium madens]|uniref:aldo-keto reductase family 1 member B1-like n=1 Tax=Tribolium madens TaxID=41895 RepID=UPI001CF765F7|nr:aldo-keto reductase family 1 member B1-like [Tribolium madens]XP_044252327.1 aldo-keto reductase family 1 member B1-like [Tribolium madens]
MSPRIRDIPITKLNNGVEIPVFGLAIPKSFGDNNEVREVLVSAISLGYRLIDCAIFENEEKIGVALQQLIKEGKTKREDLFIIGKLYCSNPRSNLIKPALITTLEKLQTTYLDLYLIHQPAAFNDKNLIAVDFVNTWKAMEELYREKLTRAIGLSNFNSKQIECILKNSAVCPQVNQIECHPYLNQARLRKYCSNNGITVISYSHLDSSRNSIRPENPNVFDDSRIKKNARRYNKTPIEIVLRYNLQLENVVISESLIENVNFFDFYIAPEDMSYIATFDCEEYNR